MGAVCSPTRGQTTNPGVINLSKLVMENIVINKSINPSIYQITRRDQKPPKEKHTQRHIQKQIGLVTVV